VKDVVNSSIRKGIWPNTCKIEMVTPVPKENPPKSIDQLRNISGLKTLNKIFEKLITKLMVSDLSKKLDPSQYANQRGISIQHYLVKLLDKILTSLDSKGNPKAVLATLVDWKQAFPRQCPKLGILSFIENGVRPALIPILINFFRDRKMIVKWKGLRSKIRDLCGGGPQGSSIGIWEYLSLSNDNADFVSAEERFKFVDDLTIVEVIELLSIGLASYNVKKQVPSDIPTHNQVIEANNLKSQTYLKDLSDWTMKKKMVLNEKKTKNIMFNFTNKYQFTTKLTLNNEPLEIPNKVKLLGTIINSKLKWDDNTNDLIKRAHKRMQILYKAANYTKSRKDLKDIYVTFIRSIVEQSSVVWHSSLTNKNRSDLERVQKVAVRIIMGTEYKSYKSSLKSLKLESLEQRRESLALRFALQCTKNEKLKNWFPLNEKRRSRKGDKYKVFKAYTKRYKQSTLPYLRRILNKNAIEKNEFKRLS